MSQSDFKVHLNAIAPAVAELDRPKIEAGQVWRMRNGDLTEALCMTGNPLYPFGDATMRATWTSGGVRDLRGDALAHTDLAELIQDADGFTIWRGGDRPESYAALVTVRFKDGSGSTDLAGSYTWGDDIVAYKVVKIKTAQDPGALTGSPDGADALAYTIDLGNTAGDRHVESVEIPPGYDKLFAVLVRAFEQASSGKGKERHAGDGVPFEDQPMGAINRGLGSVDGFLYQAAKKATESRRLPAGRAQAELLGAINYLVGAVIAYDTWYEKDLPKN